jgi:hypothetical protein
MPEELQEYRPSVPESSGAAAPLSFSEFPRQKGEEYHERRPDGDRWQFSDKNDWITWRGFVGGFQFAVYFKAKCLRTRAQRARILRTETRSELPGV